MSYADFAKAKACVSYFLKMGLCPLPSRMDVKGPMLPTYAEHYEGRPVPRWVYEKWSTTNMQVITGVKSPTATKIVVVDLDGAEAAEAWDRISSHHGYPGNKGWISQTGSGGLHHWYLLPEGTVACPSGIIWGLWDTWGRNDKNPGKGDWCKHKEVRILGDNALVIAPPSIHVTTGKPYAFREDAGPRRTKRPEVAPSWLLSMPRLSAPRFFDPTPIRTPVPYKRGFGKFYSREEVLDAVGGDKLSIAVNEWGLVPKCDMPNLRGWCSCYVPGREIPGHSKPSGSFHFMDGTFQDRKDLSCISFFDLSVVLGAYTRWQDCRDALGDRYIGKNHGDLSKNGTGGKLNLNFEPKRYIYM